MSRRHEPPVPSSAATRFDRALTSFKRSLVAIELCPAGDETRLAALCDRSDRAAKVLKATPAPDLPRFVRKLKAMVEASWECPIPPELVWEHAEELADLVAIQAPASGGPARRRSAPRPTPALSQGANA